MNMLCCAVSPYKVEMSGENYDNIQSNSGVGVCHEQLK
jgi:hypothetical protein